MLFLTVVAALIAAALCISIALRASDRFPTETSGPGPWGVRSRQKRAIEFTSAEERWRRLIDYSTRSSEPWAQLTADLDHMADVHDVPRAAHPPTFSQRHLDERLAALEARQKDQP